MTRLPLHAFRNLELLSIVVQRVGNKGILDDEAFNTDSYGQIGETRAALEAMLDGSGDWPTGLDFDRLPEPLSTPLRRSDNLKVVAIGENDTDSIIHSRSAIRPWKVIHPSSADDNTNITFEPVSIKDLGDIDPGYDVIIDKRDRLCYPKSIDMIYRNM